MSWTGVYFSVEVLDLRLPPEVADLVAPPIAVRATQPDDDTDRWPAPSDPCARRPRRSRRVRRSPRVLGRS